MTTKAQSIVFDGLLIWKKKSSKRVFLYIDSSLTVIKKMLESEPRGMYLKMKADSISHN